MASTQRSVDQSEEDTSAVIEITPARSQQQNRPQRRPPLGLRKRERQALQITHLEREVLALKRHIQQLTELRDFKLSQHLNRHDDIDGSSLKAVVEYFRVFEKGLILSPVDAIAFVNQIMADDIVVNNFTGRGLVIDQWKTHSICFNDISFRIRSVTVIPLTENEAIVKCVARFSAMISRLTLTLMFPHIVHHHTLMNKLIGRRLEGDGLYDFVYNSTSQQFVRCEVVMDLFGVFAKLLPDPHDLALLFQQALITDEFYIGEVDDDAAQSPRSYDSEADNQADSDIDSGTPVSPPSDVSTPPSNTSTPPLEKMNLSHILDEA